MKFSQKLVAGSPFAAREFSAGWDAVTLATDILALDHDAFSAALRKSPIERAKLAGLKRNAAVVLTNKQTAADRVRVETAVRAEGPCHVQRST